MTGQDFSKESGLHLTKHEIQNRVAVNYEEELVPKYSWAAKKIFNTEEHRG
jgi:sulfur carrier protein ThiS